VSGESLHVSGVYEYSYESSLFGVENIGGVPAGDCEDMVRSLTRSKIQAHELSSMTTN